MLNCPQCGLIPTGFAHKTLSDCLREMSQRLTEIEAKLVPEKQTAPLVLVRSQRSEVRRVLEVVCGKYGLTVKEIQNGTNRHAICRPRQIAMYLLRRRGMSFPQIGWAFCGKNHTTVMYAVNAVAERRSFDAEFDAEVAALEQRVREQGRAAA